MHSLFICLIFSSLINSCLCAQVLQITDFHFDKDYDRYGDITNFCHRSGNEPLREDIGEFGNYHCDSPLALVNNSLRNAKNTIPNPDFILWTGDNVPHIDGYNEDYVINALSFATSLLNSTFPTTQIIPTFGNHDYAPANAFPDNYSNIYTRTYDLWKDWIGSDAKDTFLKGGYYKFSFNNATFLVLNTNIYFRFNTANFTNPDDPADQFKFMADTLEDAKNNNQIIHVIAHIAPGVYERSPNFTWMFPEHNQKFVDITLKYASVIKWMIFGHHHSDTFHVLKNGSDPVQLMLMCPAVTPWYSDLSGGSSNNPAFRIIEYDDQTWDYTDIKTYYVKLLDLNKNSSINWTLEYSFTDAYNLTQINAQTMYDLLQKMKVDDNWFYQYMMYNSVGWSTQVPEGDLRLGQLCSIEYPDYPGYYKCMANGTTPLSPPPPTGSSQKCSVSIMGIFFLFFSTFLVFL